MSDLVARVVERLRQVGVRLEPGLSDSELAKLERAYGVVFGPEHRKLLQTALPTGSSAWPDWRHGPAKDLQGRISWPTDSVIFDVHHDGFWPTSWGTRPQDPSARERQARNQLALVPRLLPLYGHRYLAVDPAFRPSPVFSVYQTDVIYYGDDLVDWVAREFGVAVRRTAAQRKHVPFWSNLAEGAANQDL